MLKLTGHTTHTNIERTLIIACVTLDFCHTAYRDIAYTS